MKGVKFNDQIENSDRRRSSAPDFPSLPMDHEVGRERSLSAFHDRRAYALGGVNKGAALRESRRERKKTIVGNLEERRKERKTIANISSMQIHEETPLVVGDSENGEAKVDEEHHFDALKEMFLENKVNVMAIFLPFAWWSQHFGWSDGSVFILNFLAMVPLASMLGVFTEELAAHTNPVIGGLINATFGNAVEMVVAIQALLAGDYRIVQASLIGSIFSNLLLVLGMCFLFGGIMHTELEFVSQGATASIAMLGFFGLMLLLPEFFGAEGGEENVGDIELHVSWIGAVLLVLLYIQLLYFQLKTHSSLFEDDSEMPALIPFSWALMGLVVITAMVTVLSEWLVGSIDGFCEEFKFGKSFVGVVLLPVVGNAVEHISAVTVAMKKKIDLALGIALGSSVQIGLFVLPMVVLVGAFTDHDMSLKFPRFEVYLYLLSVVIVSMCLANEKSNWLEGSLLVFAYIIISVGIFYEDKFDKID